MAFRAPIRIASGGSPSGNTLGIIYGMNSASMAVLGSLISLVGLNILDNSTVALSLSLFLSALISLPIVLYTGSLINLLTRKYVFTIGVFIALSGNLMFLLDTPITFVLANAFRMAGGGLMFMCISLYTMDFTPRKQLARAESRKFLFAGISWLIFPFVGTWMWVNVDYKAPFLLSITLLSILIAIFWWLRISEAQNIKPPKSGNLNFIKNVRTYFGNPHMRVAYLIAVARSSSWVVFFTYGPIYLRDAGISTQWIGLFMGGIMAALLLSSRFAAIAQYIGIRKTILLSFSMAGISMITLGLLPEPTIWGLLLLLLASLGFDMLDIIGNIPFMRMVTPKVRVEMTSVFSTWREMSFVVTPGLSAFILIFTDISGLFLVLGIVLVIAGLLSRTMPIRVD
jgi:ACDE family multidrug resistance protein